MSENGQTGIDKSCYQRGDGAVVDSNIKVVDMRSDTLTLPTKGMLDAIVNAKLGDDVYSEDPTVNALQDNLAAAFGKEASLFVVGGTMGNLISIMSHCDSRGSEVILGSKCHVHKYEQGSVASIAGVHHRAVENNPDGTFCLDKVRSLIRADDPHFPVTRAILVENTHNACGGRVLPISFLKRVRDLADEFGLAVHMDGARVMNAATALGVDVKEIVKFADSVSMCFSKGLGAPFGAIIAGEKRFIQRALRHRKVLGGGMRQAGIMAAAAQYAFDRAPITLAEDHRRAKLFADLLGKAVNDSGVVSVDPSIIDSNMVFMACAPVVKADELVGLLNSVTESEKAQGDLCIVKALDGTPTSIRFVLSLNLNDEDVTFAVGKIVRVVNEIKRRSDK